MREKACSQGPPLNFSVLASRVVAQGPGEGCWRSGGLQVQPFPSIKYKRVLKLEWLKVSSIDKSIWFKYKGKKTLQNWVSLKCVRKGSMSWAVPK